MFYARPISLGHLSRYCDISCYYLCFVFVCHTVLSVPCSLVDTCWERADLLTLLYVVFYCVFVTFPYGDLGMVWYLIVSLPDLCLLSYIYFRVMAGKSAHLIAT